MKENTMAKINKLGKVGYIISKAGKIIIAAAAIACIVGAAILWVIPKDTVKLELMTANSVIIHLDESADYIKTLDLDTSDGFLELGKNSYKIVADDTTGGETVTRVIYLTDLKWFLLVLAIACAAAYAVLYFAARLCKKFKDCETPFTEEVSKELTCLAWSMIPVSFLGFFAESLSDSLISGSVDVTIGVDLTVALLILCVFMLSYIFKYGTALQTESDETL